MRNILNLPQVAWRGIRLGWVNALILILGFLGMFVGALPIANADEAEKYIGEIYSYGDFPGFAFSDKKNRIPDPEYLQVLFIEGKYFLLAKKNEELRSIVIVDAIAIPKGQVFIGIPFENECKANNYPNETIFVTGKWVNRKTPNGGFAGGYANPITKAWRVNFERKKLEVIPTAGVKCQDNRTDADVN